MGDAGTGECLPESGIDRVLVADGERDQYPRIQRVRQCGAKAVADVFAQHLHRVTGTPDLSLDARGAGRTHVTGGADAAFEQPRLVIEAMGIQVAVRALEAHREVPALAGAHRDRGRGLVVRVVVAAIPGQRDARRHTGHRLLHLKLEAHTAFQRLRQACDHAGQFDVAAFQRARQFVGQARLRKNSCPGETKGRGAGDKQGRRQESPSRQRRLLQSEQGQGARAEAGEPHEGRQSRLLLQQPDAGGKGRNEKAHGALCPRREPGTVSPCGVCPRREPGTVSPCGIEHATRRTSAAADADGSVVQGGAEFGEVLGNFLGFYRLAELQGNLRAGQQAA